MAEKKKYYIFEVAKFIACIMIINSHCRELYPVQYLAVGGAFGNGIFFILSGYFNYNIKDNFNDWIAKKVARLMPAVLITILVEELINIIVYNKIIKPLDIINQYWFIFALFEMRRKLLRNRDRNPSPTELYYFSRRSGAKFRIDFRSVPSS